MAKKKMPTSNKQYPKNTKQKREMSQLKQVCVGVLLAIAVYLALNIFNTYKDITRIPELPDLDLNRWWGPNSTKETQDITIRPYKIIFSESTQDMLSKHFEFYRSREKVPSFPESNFSYGFNRDTLAEIFNFWAYQYNIKQRERYFNTYNHFITNIQGLDIHYVRVTPDNIKYKKVYPLLMLHGWPGSIKEFYGVIPLLTAMRDDYDFVFELIIPSLPGFGFSQGAVRPGLNNVEIAIIMHNLMQRLGINKYYVQGGDFGHNIGSHLATLFPEEVLGFHTNFVVNFNPLTSIIQAFGSIMPSFIVEKQFEDRIYPLSKKIPFWLEESGYLHLQMTKPDTIGTVLQDSPMGLAAYILERFVIFTDPSFKDWKDGGLKDKYTYMDLLDNVMVYWSAGCITTSMRLYAESWKNQKLEQNMFRIPTAVPTWGLRLKHEIIYQPDFLIKMKFTNFIGSTNLPYGGHYAAFEMPDIFANDIFLAVQAFRNANEINNNKS